MDKSARERADRMTAVPIVDPTGGGDAFVAKAEYDEYAEAARVGR